jgi:hypothetical protein
MPNQAIWHCIQAVASALRNADEEALSAMQTDLRMMGPNQQGELRKDFKEVIAGLTLLETRMTAELDKSP